jgi:hypothetical protein
VGTFTTIDPNSKLSAPSAYSALELECLSVKSFGKAARKRKLRNLTNGLAHDDCWARKARAVVAMTSRAVAAILSVLRRATPAVKGHSERLRIVGDGEFGTTNMLLGCVSEYCMDDIPFSFY